MTTQLALPPESASVPAARRFVRSALVALGAAGAVDDAEVLVSELATNAVVHARTSFTVEVARDGATVRVCVADASPAGPRTRSYGADATTGRGMRLVASLSSAWGVEVRGSGKSVWVEIPADGVPAEVPSWDQEVDVDSLLAGFDEEGTAGPTGPLAQVLLAVAA